LLNSALKQRRHKFRLRSSLSFAVSDKATVLHPDNIDAVKEALMETIASAHEELDAEMVNITSLEEESSRRLEGGRRLAAGSIKANYHADVDEDSTLDKTAGDNALKSMNQDDVKTSFQSALTDKGVSVTVNSAAPDQTVTSEDNPEVVTPSPTIAATPAPSAPAGNGTNAVPGNAPTASLAMFSRPHVLLSFLAVLIFYM